MLGRSPRRSCRPDCERPACGGRNARSASRVAARERRQRRGRCASHASASRMPGPPALVTTPTRGPAGTGWVDSSAATSNSSSSVLVRITPACANERVDGDVEARQRRRVARRGARAGRRASRLDRDDRLLAAPPPARGARTCAGCRSSRGRARSRACAGRRPSRRADRCPRRRPCCRPRRTSRARG